jgi:hypothetical protein
LLGLAFEQSDEPSEFSREPQAHLPVVNEKSDDAHIRFSVNYSLNLFNISCANSLTNHGGRVFLR